MSETPKPLSGVLLFVELIFGMAFSFAIIAYILDLPPSVKPGTIATVVFISTRILYFALIVWLFNSGLRRRSQIMLVGAAFLFLVLIMISFPQY